MGPRPDGRGTPQRRPPWTPTRSASMGPRPDGRGTVRAGRRQVAGTRLQWGRDRMAAERVRHDPQTAGMAGFNGAATGWPRNDSGGFASEAEAALQWGRDRMAAER